MSDRVTKRGLGFALAVALCLSLSGSLHAQELLRMDLNGKVETVDTDPPPVGFDDSNLAHPAFPFNNLGLTFSGSFAQFPDFGGLVQKFYFEFPTGVTSIQALTIFDDHDPSVTCPIGGASFDIHSGPEIHAIEAWGEIDPAGMPGVLGTVWADAVVTFIPGKPITTDDDPTIIGSPFLALSDNYYGLDMPDPNDPLADLWPGACLDYANLRGTDIGTLPNMTHGLAGLPDMVLGPANPNGIYGLLETQELHDSAGLVLGPFDCDGDMSAERAAGPVFATSAPTSPRLKEVWPGYKSLGCGGLITINFAVPVVPKPGSGIAGADLVIYEAGFAEEPLAAIGSSDPIDQVNTDLRDPMDNTITLLDIDCSIDETACALFEITNDTEAEYSEGGLGIDWNEWRFELRDTRPVTPFATVNKDEMDFLEGGAISGATGSNVKALGPYPISCQSYYYFYTWFNEPSGEDDGDGDGEHVFASYYNLTGVPFEILTGMSTEPAMFDPCLATPDACPMSGGIIGGRAVPVVVNTGGTGTPHTVKLYRFSLGAEIGAMRAFSPTKVEVHPRNLNRESPGNWVTAYVSTMGDLHPADLDPATIQIQGLLKETGVAPSRWRVGDGNADGEPDLMLKFPRAAVADLLADGPEVLITLRGKTWSGESWVAQDAIEVKSRGISRDVRARGR